LELIIIKTRRGKLLNTDEHTINFITCSSILYIQYYIADLYTYTIAQDTLQPFQNEND